MPQADHPHEHTFKGHDDTCALRTCDRSHGSSQSTILVERLAWGDPGVPGTVSGREALAVPRLPILRGCACSASRRPDQEGLEERPSWNTTGATRRDLLRRWGVRRQPQQAPNPEVCRVHGSQRFRQSQAVARRDTSLKKQTNYLDIGGRPWRTSWTLAY